MKNIRLYYDASAYYKAKAELPNPDGKHCIICNADLPKRRQKYCSDECFMKWWGSIKINNWSEVRKKVRKRDHYTCRRCGITNKELQSKYSSLDVRSNLEVHHIIPISRGGAEFDPANCITLCHNCHKETTKLLAPIG